MAAKKVLSVGQCMADHTGISWTIRGQFGAEVVPAATYAEARELLQDDSFALVLVNRVLDADGSSGVDVIRQLKAAAALKDTPVMLVSNYEDAQNQAVDAGAVRGFGKAGLREAETAERLKAFLG